MRTIFAGILIATFFSNSSMAQNLLPNGGFEDYNCVPKVVAQWNCAKDWFPANAGSPDMYNRNSPRLVGIPENNIGMQDAHDGGAYAGLILLDKYEGIVEYFETKLIKPLQKDKKYYFSMYVSLAEKSMYGINSIGAYFSSTKIVRGKWEGIYLTPQIANNADSILYDVKRWCKIDGYYTASGGEQYLVIGNFTREDQIKRQQINDDGVSDVLSYYYIDDVKLTAIAEPQDSKIAPVNSADITCPGTKYAMQVFGKEKNDIEEKKLKAGNSFVLKNIYFDFDKNILLPSSYEELDKLVALLKDHPTMRIEIRGHTDNKGSNAYNARLSTYRARAVVEYLTGKNINANRLRYKGFGSKIPIASNANEKGRSQNRRVEFTILKM